jgi:hypothetical protein
MEIEENYKCIIFSQLQNKFILTETLVSVEISLHTKWENMVNEHARL